MSNDASLGTMKRGGGVGVGESGSSREARCVRGINPVKNYPTRRVT